jgi:hypothetical protein
MFNKDVGGGGALWYKCGIQHFFVLVPPDVISLQLFTPQSCWCIMQVIRVFNLHLMELSGHFQSPAALS